MGITSRLLEGLRGAQRCHGPCSISVIRITPYYTRHSSSSQNIHSGCWPVAMMQSAKKTVATRSSSFNISLKVSNDDSYKMKLRVRSLNHWCQLPEERTAVVTMMTKGGNAYRPKWKNGGILLSSVAITIFLLIGLTTSQSSHLKTHVDYRGANLKFVVFHNPPFDTFIRKQNGTFIFYGVALHVLQWMAADFNFTYTLVAVNQTLVDTFGTHEASFYQLINDKEIDGIPCAFFLTQDRIKRMDFTSFFVWVDGFSLIVPKPGEESRLFAFIRPFQPAVWFWILVTIVFVVGMMIFFTWFYLNPFLTNIKNVSITNRENLNQRSTRSTVFSSFSSCMIYIVNIMTNQGCREAFDRHSFRILTGFWVLGAMVLVNSYSSIVISSLTVPKMKPPIETLKDLASSKEVGIVLRHDMTMGEQILKATNGVYKLLGDRARQNPNQILGDPFKLNAMLETGKYAYPFIQTFNSWFVALQYKKDGRCRFHATKPLPVPHGYYSWLVKKGSPNSNVFSEGLVRLWESGLTRFWSNSAIGLAKAAECFDSKRQKTSVQQVPIRLLDLTSAFLILGIGIGLAIFCFLLELIISRFHRRIYVC